MRGLVTPGTRVALAVIALTFITNCGDDPVEPEGNGVAQAGSVALATASNGAGLTISTDKDDYAPGDTVWFTGTGWTPGDTLEVVLTDDPTQDYHAWTIGIASDGTFRDSTYVVDVTDVGVSFTLTATSRTNLEQTLTVNFTDGQPTNVTVTAIDASVAPTETASYDILVSMGGNTNACTVNMSVTGGLPTGTTFSFTGNPRVLPAGSGSTNFNSTLSLVTTGATPPGTYTFTVLAARGTGCQGAAGTGPTATGTLIVFGAATKLAFLQQPSNTDATASITPAVTVQVLDANNNVVTNSAAPVMMAIGTNPGGGTLSGTLTQAAVNGVATFADLSINKAANGYRLAASSSGLTGATSSLFNITVGPAAKLVFSTQPSGGTPGSAFTTQPVVQVQDAGGNVKTTGAGSGASITLTIVPGSGTGGAALSCTTNPLGATSGVASYGGCKINLAGMNYRLRASTMISGNPFSVDSDPFNVTVANQPPTVNAGSYTVAEGTQLTLSPTVNDPDGDPLTYKWTVNTTGIDGVGTCTFLSDTEKNAKVTCTDDSQGAPGGKFTLTLEVDDGTADPVSDDADLEVTNVDPTATFNTPSGDVNEGSPFNLSLSGATDESSVDAGALKYAFDCGTGYSATDYASASSSSSTSCTAADGPATPTVKGKVFDDDGGSNEYTGTVTVKNVPPTATFEKPTSVNEGSSFTLKLKNATDASSADLGAGLHFTFDCGDGSGYQTDYASAGTDYSITCTNAVDGPATLSVKGKVFDKDEGSTEYTASVTVNNVPPTITSITTNPASPLTLGVNNQVSTTVTVNFTDPAAANDAPYSSAIDCGNGTSTTGSPTTYGSSSGTCTYTLAQVGKNTISATVTDNDNGTSDAKTLDIYVYYLWTGFFQPVDNPPGYNSAKAGSGIPVKFNLNGNQGLNIFDSSYPKPFTIACDGQVPQDPIEETVNAGQSSLTYDAVAHQYIYVWKTDRNSTGCRRLDLKLKDGSTHSAYFKFTK